ncbi:Uncharacterised protein [Yersinia enterocolitica]|nr:Uncharacterised protein [Yersinia enterocolitica]
METIFIVIAPLSNIATNLKDITIRSSIELAVSITGAIMPTFVAHPHTGDFLLASERINVVTFP